MREPIVRKKAAPRAGGSTRGTFCNNLGTLEANQDVWGVLATTLPGTNIPVVGAMGIDIPCGTWSRARGGGGGPPKIRGDTPETLFGLEGVKPHDLRKLNEANKQVDYALNYIEWAIDKKVPGYMENPSTSRIWQHPRIQKHLREDRAWMVYLDMCQYGTAWKKGTALLIYGVPAYAFKMKQCRGKPRGTCTATCS